MNHLTQATDNNKKLAILELPTAEGTTVEYYIDASYVGGVASDDLLNAISSAMVFRGTLGASGATITALPTANKNVVGDVYKYIDEAGSVSLNGTATDLKRGDIIICAETSTGVYNWVLVPSGDVDGVLSISKGDGIKLYNKAGNEVNTLDREGTIKVDTAVTDNHTHTIGFEGTHKHDFTGTAATVTMNSYTPSGSVSITVDDTTGTGKTAYTPTGSITINHTPAGTVTTTATKETKTATVSGALSAIEIADHAAVPYIKTIDAAFVGDADTISVSGTPTGTVTIGIDNEVGDKKTEYTPEGTINDLTFTGTEVTHNVVGALSAIGFNDHTVSVVKGVKTQTFTGTAATINVGEHTPEGEVKSSWTMADNNHDTTTHAFSGTQATVSVSGSATVSTAKEVVTDISTENVTNLLDTSASVVTGDSDFVTAITHDYTQSAKKVKITWGSGKALTTANLSHGTTVQAIKSVTPTKEVVTSTGTSAGTGSYTPAGTISTEKLTITGGVESTFTGKKDDTFTASYTPEGTINVTLERENKPLTHVVDSNATSTANVTVTCKPSGSITKPVFTGTTKYFSANFAGNLLTSTGSYTPEGDITFDITRNEDVLKHTYTPTTTGVTVNYDTCKEFTSTFSGALHNETIALNGTTQYFGASFGGNAATLSGSYTPAGTISDATLEFDGTTSTGGRS